MPATQPIRHKNQVRGLSDYYLGQGNLRNYLLVVMGVHTALRISDLLRITWDDVYDFNRCCFLNSIYVSEKKTGKTSTVKLNKSIMVALNLCLPLAKSGNHLFLSRKGGAIGRAQAYRIIRSAAEALEFQSSVSCHSLRKTFGYHAWKSGISPAVLMEIYNHSNFAVTRRYLGVTQDDKDEVFDRLGEIL